MSTDPTDARATPEPDKVEHAKRASRFLRGNIAQTLANAGATHFEHDDLVSLKFHGVYQQDDRDQRNARRAQGLDKSYSFMIRVAVPGGRCTARQYLDLDDLAAKHANGTLRLTTRQAFQLHGVAKGDLHHTMRSINAALLTSLAACGDIPRNVMAPPAPFADEIHRGVQALALDLAVQLRPATGAYHEIWVDGERYTDPDAPAREEPFYGDTYLPRKFKLGVAIDTDNSIDVYAYDAGLIAVTRHGRITGYVLTVGGGLGMTHNKPDTIARIASPIALIRPAHAVEAMRAVVEVYRDHGNRHDRRHARIKYLLEDWGVNRFRRELAARVGFELADPPALPAPVQLDHLGRFDQGDGRQFIGVWVPNGRVADTPQARYRSAFRAVAGTLAPTVILTPMQSLLFADLTPDQADQAEDILRDHGVPRAQSLSAVRRYSMACPALPTCGLALAESERVQPAIIGAIESVFDELAIGDVPLTVRMTGCPNGCARPYNADIGLVGRRPGVYHLYVGGGLGGDRLADLFAADVEQDRIADTLRPLLIRYRDERRPREPLGDFYRRAIADQASRTLITGKEEPSSVRYRLAVLP
jgi:sulfite reductase beta subunit-like hemoprotein